MPQWGRPSGAQAGRRRRDRNSTTRPKDNRRFEEIDSGTGDSEGDSTNASFISDELQFTGADLGDRTRHRRSFAYDYSSESSDEDLDEAPEASMQLILRDKEELLVQKALERIHRARMLGKTNVKLSQRELDALERKQQKDRPRRKSSRLDLKLTDRQRNGGKSSSAWKEQSSRRKFRGSTSPVEEGRLPTHATPLGVLAPSRDAPSSLSLGYYQPTTRPQNRRSGEVLPRSFSQQQSSPPLSQQPRSRGPKNRQSSSNTPPQTSPPSGTAPLPRRLPDDPGWIPRSLGVVKYGTSGRSLSVPTVFSSPSAGTHPLYGQSENCFWATRCSLSRCAILGSRRIAVPLQPSAASSEPSLLRRDDSAQPIGEKDYSDVDSDSDGHGVQVNIAPYNHGYSANTGPEALVGRPKRGQR